MCRKSRVKWLASRMPTLILTSLIRRKVDSNSSLATCMRRILRTCAGENPSCCLNRCRTRDAERLSGTLNSAAPSSCVNSHVSSISSATCMRGSLHFALRIENRGTEWGLTARGFRRLRIYMPRDRFHSCHLILGRTAAECNKNGALARDSEIPNRWCVFAMSPMSAKRTEAIFLRRVFRASCYTSVHGHTRQQLHREIGAEPNGRALG
jgi:hypothetical protein